MGEPIEYITKTYSELSSRTRTVKHNQDDCLLGRERNLVKSRESPSRSKMNIKVEFMNERYGAFNQTYENLSGGEAF